MNDIFTFQINQNAPDFKYSKIKLYENFIREELVNPVFAKFRRELEEKGDAATPIYEKMMSRFRFDKIDGTRFLLSSLDILGDSEAAITELHESKIENGMTNNHSQMYLRIYGVLSAVYIHNQSIKVLCELFKVQEAAEIKDKIGKSGIMFLRHIISAHPLNFLTEDDTTESFQLVRMSLTNGGNLQVRNHNGEFKYYNIFDLLREYESLAESALYLIATKMIGLLFRTNADRTTDSLSQLNKIKDESD
jgi:hypothetical protein